jgi:hypothetical protein
MELRVKGGWGGKFGEGEDCRDMWGRRVKERGKEE